MKEGEERLRNLEIEVATMRQMVDRNYSDIKDLEEQLEKNTTRLDKWGGGSVIVAKIVGLLCSLIGSVIALAKLLAG